jgi:hypothetical protein
MIIGGDIVIRIRITFITKTFSLKIVTRTKENTSFRTKNHEKFKNNSFRCRWYFVKTKLIFAEAEEKFCDLMSDYHSKQSIAPFKTQIDNLPTYGYGIKGYILSMIWMTISNSTITIEVVGKLSNLVKNWKTNCFTWRS